MDKPLTAADARAAWDSVHHLVIDAIAADKNAPRGAELAASAVLMILERYTLNVERIAEALERQNQLTARAMGIGQTG